MIRLESSLPLDRIELGDVAEFRVVQEDPTTETRFFLKQHRVFYLKPLTDWGSPRTFRFLIEAPGTYTLAAQWRSADGRTGWREIDFKVVWHRRMKHGPCKIRLDKTTRIWAPTRLDALEIKSSEPEILRFLSTIVRPGTVIYDLGANLGIYAIHLARLSGTRGRVYCLEPNPICVHFLRANLALNHLTNVEILPVAALDRTGETPFTFNFGNFNLGLTADSLFYPIKIGHEIRVPCYELDDLVRHFGLRPPELIKVDVEGGEFLAVKGMEKTLAEQRPVLVMELHGEGNAMLTLETLDAFRYRYTDPISGDEFQSAAEVFRRFGNRVFHLACFPTSDPAVPVERPPL